MFGDSFSARTRGSILSSGLNSFKARTSSDTCLSLSRIHDWKRDCLRRRVVPVMLGREAVAHNGRVRKTSDFYEYQD